jgi:predicted transposase/invertase (TIGR01784 family)
LARRKTGFPGIDPKVDYAFKRLFGVERNRHLLIDLIDAVLDSPPEYRIAEVELLNPFSEKEALDDRLTILDVKARDQSGRRFNVEMQMLPHTGFRERILYDWAQLHHEQIREGDAYHVLRPTVSICFLNGNLFPHVADYRLQFGLRDGQHGLVFSPQLAIYVTELQKFGRPLEQVSGSLDRWLYFLRNAETMDTEALPSELDVPPIRRALEELQMLSQTDL